MLITLPLHGIPFTAGQNASIPNRKGLQKGSIPQRKDNQCVMLLPVGVFS
jgi:hypothetical protein